MLLGFFAAAYAFPPVAPATAAPPLHVPTPVHVATVQHDKPLQIGAHVAPATPPSTDPERILDIAERLLAIIEQQTSDIPTTSTDAPPATETPPATATPAPWSSSNLLVWETGKCLTPADVRVAHVCGSPDGDGYTIRWTNAPGDNYAGTTPSAAFMDLHTHQLPPSVLVWQQPHPRTGQSVAIHYLKGDRALQLTIAGNPVYRIDRQHKYQPLR